MGATDDLPDITCVPFDVDFPGTSEVPKCIATYEDGELIEFVFPCGIRICVHGGKVFSDAPYERYLGEFLLRYYRHYFGGEISLQRDFHRKRLMSMESRREHA